MCSDPCNGDQFIISHACTFVNSDESEMKQLLSVNICTECVELCSIFPQIDVYKKDHNQISEIQEFIIDFYGLFNQTRKKLLKRIDEQGKQIAELKAIIEER